MVSVAVPWSTFELSESFQDRTQTYSVRFGHVAYDKKMEYSNPLHMTKCRGLDCLRTRNEIGRKLESRAGIKGENDDTEGGCRAMIGYA